MDLNGTKKADLDIVGINDFADFVSTVGANKDTSVNPAEYAVPFAFEGKLKKVQISVDGADTTLEKELEAYYAAD